MSSKEIDVCCLWQTLKRDNADLSFMKLLTRVTPSKCCEWGGVMRECHLSCVTFYGLQQCVVLMSGRGVSQHWSCWPVWPYWLSALRHRERTISSDWELAAAACCTLLNSVYSMYTRTTYHTARRWPFVYFFPKYLLPFKAKCFLSNLFC